MTADREAGPLSVGPLLGAALALAARGQPVFPVHTPNTDGSCSCRRPECDDVGKHPRTRNGLKDATTDPEQIRTWWTWWHDANVGMATGKIIVLDVDPRHGGDESLHDLEQQYDPLPDTVTVETGSGGRHHWFSPPQGAEIRNSEGKIGPGLDVRGVGGYVLVPPSLHASGRRYTWSV
jgi:hypothetical protein